MTWIQTYTGRAFDLLNPRAEDVCIEDIAHALSHLCRFTGHTSDHYSVAQHCVLASNQVPPELAKAALLHDAEEAYVGDVSSPLKQAMLEVYFYSPSPYPVLSDRVSQAIGVAFGEHEALFHHPAVKEADLRLLLTERRDLLGPLRFPSPREKDWEQIGLEPYPFRIYPWPAEMARRLYLERFFEL